MRVPENMTSLGLKTRQRRDVQANVATFQRGVKFNIVTLIASVVAFQRHVCLFFY